MNVCQWFHTWKRANSVKRCFTLHETNCLKPVSRCECRLTHKKLAFTKWKTAGNDGANGQNCFITCTAYRNTQQMALLLGRQGLPNIERNPTHHATEKMEQDPSWNRNSLSFLKNGVWTSNKENNWIFSVVTSD